MIDLATISIQSGRHLIMPTSTKILGTILRELFLRKTSTLNVFPVQLPISFNIFSHHISIGRLCNLTQTWTIFETFIRGSKQTYHGFIDSYVDPQYHLPSNIVFSSTSKWNNKPVIKRYSTFVQILLLGILNVFLRQLISLHINYQNRGRLFISRLCAKSM
jgi:hypothetical protein